MTTRSLSPGLSGQTDARLPGSGALPALARMRSTHALEPPAYVKHYDSQLSHLDDWLAIIALVGKVASRSGSNGVLDRISEVQDRFRLLRVQLATALAEEYAREYEMVLGGRAAIAVDMLVRNLYERSADIGFLSTDSIIRAYMESDEAASSINIQQHFARYVAKYSVYDDVMLLNLDATLRTSLTLGDANTFHDERLYQTLSQLDNGYVEYFAATPLVPHQYRALLFISPVHQAVSNQCLGYLALSFNLEEEVRGIFNEVADGEFELALLDNDGRVVASSLPQLALNEPMQQVGAENVEVLVLNGNAYACRQVKSATYQGYGGIGWRFMALTALSGAAHHQPTAMDTSVNTDVVQGRLSDIRLQASMIAQQLNLAVINGHIISVRYKAVELVPVLHQIREIGNLTDQLFEQSISTLRRGMSLTAIADATMRAFSMVSIMDRNLYERANDARWWALDERIRKQLRAASKGNKQALAELAEVISAINRLYTVYTNILLFDREGTIVSVSDKHSEALIGTHVPETLPLAECLNTFSEQGYVVSAFTESELYANRPTYLYCAPVVDFNSSTIVGGIATVFDAAPEFRQILADNLPNSSAQSLSPFALFIDAEGQVISSTLADIAVPKLFAGGYTEVLALRDGERLFQRLEYEGNSYLSAMVASTGYREYKRNDNYRNDVIAIACLPIV
ncbi:cache domain-containing protein [Halomonas sp. ISL-60]|uniref:cache domain-containing protein n=1 Tax=Halomonas sp. ISL-56 TaxID=2819149 RepID=UPI001BEA806E|nr:cache domain-containing protein [Halomonas sp. ISL-56]MBT2774592.1 cache domain-containing protein [Halomonas sp. ISL-60]MBT2801829.1 cache domain-containing protein [Halomonas sp. ISL-56]